MPPLEGRATGKGAEETNPSPAGAGAGEVVDACEEITKAEMMEKHNHDGQDALSNLHCGNEVDSPATKQDKRVIEDSKQEQNEANGRGQAKVLKKPDKVLPCPRCNSLNTKFCYYNNYNVNQPRHFCKNCQRYWTAGGTMRNVPVGAGRRKSKHSLSHYRNMLMSSDAMSSPQLNITDPANNQVHVCDPPVATMPVKNDETVLNVVAEKSIASVPNMNEQKGDAEMRHVFCAKNREEPSCASALTALNGLENETADNAAHIEQNGSLDDCNGLAPMHYVQCYPAFPWACAWSPGWNSVAPMAAGRCSSELMHGQEIGITNPVPWNPPPLMAAPPFCGPTIPFPFFSPFFWGCASSWPNGTWNVPWIGPSCISPSSSAGDGGCSGLGKHSREASLSGEEKTEKSLWVPKTLRIDDPDEAAKSSIWATLGIMPDSTIKKGGIFGGFQPKTGSKSDSLDGNNVLHVNPAAFSRSQAFQEST